MSVKSELALEGQALRGRWPMSRAMREALLARAGNIAMTSENERTAVAAIKLFVEADKLNMAEEDAAKPKSPATGVQVNVQVNTGDVVRKAMGDDRSAELLCELAERLADGGAHAGQSGDPGHGGEVQTGPSPEDPQPPVV